jgi:hypothetical protein
MTSFEINVSTISYDVPYFDKSKILQIQSVVYTVKTFYFWRFFFLSRAASENSEQLASLASVFKK